MLLIRAGILSHDPDQRNENNFNTDAYLAGQYTGLVNKPIQDLNPNSTGERNARMEDGILLPKYRLPTEAEWEYAALGLMDSEEMITERRIYPWSGHLTRNSSGKSGYGYFLANYKRARGDYMGVAGSLNDGADITAPVGIFPPNDFGLYNMAGNVAEWVQDVYRPLSHNDVADLNPFRGNVFKKPQMEGGELKEKDSLGRIRYQNIESSDFSDRLNYRSTYNINYLDGDNQSLINTTEWNTAGVQPDSLSKYTNQMYGYGKSSLINDQARVVKGGSWKDGAFYLSPGVRRYLNEENATDYIGFRCAMDRVGATNR